MNSDISNIQQLTRLLQEQEIHHIVYFSSKSNIAFNLIKHYSIIIIQHHNHQVIMLTVNVRTGIRIAYLPVYYF